MAISAIGYSIIFLGLPLVAWLGILAFIFLALTAIVGFLNFKGNHTIPFKFHPKLAALTIIIVIIH